MIALQMWVGPLCLLATNIFRPSPPLYIYVVCVCVRACFFQMILQKHFHQLFGVLYKNHKIYKNSLSLRHGILLSSNISFIYTATILYATNSLSLRHGIF